MTNVAQQLVEDTTSDAPRRVLQAVLLQAINDIEATIAPNATPGTITRIQNHRKDAENFFWELTLAYATTTWYCWATTQHALKTI